MHQTVRPRPNPCRPKSLAIGLVFCLAILGWGVPAGAQVGTQDPPAIQLRILGGLASLSQYTKFETPFWTRRVPELTGDTVRAEIAPFDRSGVRGTELLQLMRLGVIPFGNILVAVAAAEEPELNGVDLPALNPDLPALRRTVELWRPRLRTLLRDRYGIEALAIYTYPAQVVFCRQPFSGLADLAGRRVRTSSVGQSELVAALGGVPVLTSFADTLPAMRGGTVECAITAALSGNAIGLQEVTSHLSRLAISWGVSIFGANGDAWAALPEPTRAQLNAGLAELEAEIWAAAERETEEGLLCNAGRRGCVAGRTGRMTLVEERWQDEARRLQLLRDAVLPGWVRRCGNECAETWNRFLAPSLNLWAAPQ